MTFGWLGETCATLSTSSPKLGCLISCRAAAARAAAPAAELQKMKQEWFGCGSVGGWRLEAGRQRSSMSIAKNGKCGKWDKAEPRVGCQLAARNWQLTTGNWQLATGWAHVCSGCSGGSSGCFSMGSPITGRHCIRHAWGCSLPAPAVACKYLNYFIA